MFSFLIQKPSADALASDLSAFEHRGPAHDRIIRALQGTVTETEEGERVLATVTVRDEPILALWASQYPDRVWAPDLVAGLADGCRHDGQLDDDVSRRDQNVWIAYVDEHGVVPPAPTPSPSR